MSISQDLTGKHFGRFEVMGQSGRSTSNKTIIWTCLCSCGNQFDTRTDRILSGRTKSCGCINKERLKKRTIHGLSRSPEYRAYHDAKQRCTDTRRENYKYYGGRGIKFLFISFPDFYKEIGPKPQKHSLDRIDNNGHYEPGNVRWATTSIQNQNRRILNLNA